MNRKLLKITLTDIRFWILFFFGLRLFGITNAPLETGHNWRQSLTNMIARNFLEIRANMLYPQIDMAGAESGIIGSEFPFFNYLIYIFSYVFGYSHWMGRLINLIASSVGLYFFYLLVKKLLNKNTAFNATLILTASIWFAFSRKIMPDTFSVSLVIIALYFAVSYLQKGSMVNFLLFFVLSTLGMLCKIPALSLFCVLGLVVLVDGVNFRRKLNLFIGAAASLLIVCCWYFYWVPFLLDTYHYQLYFPKSISIGIHEILPLIPQLLEKFYFSALSSYTAFFCFIAGLFMLFKERKKFLLLGIGIISACFLVFIIKTGAVFPLHNYYIIPFVPVMALVAGYATAKAGKFQHLLLALIVIEGIANQQHDFFVKDSQLYKLKLEKITAEFIPEEELIVINGGASPQDIYFTHRKGWTVHSSQLGNPQFLDSLISLGAEKLIIDRTDSELIFEPYPQIFADKDYLVYDLN